MVTPPQTFLSALNPEISVIVPVRNEEDNILPLLAEIVAALHPLYPFEIVYIDDGSSDATLQRLQEAQQEYPMLRIARHESCCGQSRAVATGIRLARADLIATLDGDGQNDPADLPAMLERMRALPAKERDNLMLAGFRHKRYDSRIKLVSSYLARQARALLLRDTIPDSGCGIKMFTRSAFLELPYFDHMHRFLPVLMKRRGGNVESIPVTHRPRHRGVSKYGIGNRLWVSLIDLLGVMWLQRRARHPLVTLFENKPAKK